MQVQRCHSALCPLRAARARQHDRLLHSSRRTLAANDTDDRPFEFLARNRPQPRVAPQPRPRAPAPSPTIAPASLTQLPAKTTVIPSSSSLYMQEDARLDRITITAYNAHSFDIFAPSALPRSASDGDGDSSIYFAQAMIASPAATLPTYTAPHSSTITGSPITRHSLSQSPGRIEMRGSIVATQTFAMLWAPTQWADVTVDSLLFLSLLHPRPELILFGCGPRVQQLSPAVNDYLVSLGIGYDVLASSDASATFNMLSSEDRRVMAVLLPMGETGGGGEDRDVPWSVKQEKLKARLPSRRIREQIDRQLRV